MVYPQPHVIEFAPGRRFEFWHEVMMVPASEGGGGAFRPPHAQDFFELVYFNAGARDIRIGGTVHSFRAGDVMIVRPDEEHASRNVTCMLDRYHLHIPQDALDLLTDSAALTRVFTGRGRCEGNRIRPDEEMQKALQEQMAHLDWIVRFSGSEVRSAEALACVIRILGLVSDAAVRGGCRAEAQRGLLLKILSFMEHALASESVMKEAQAAFGLSRSSLWRLFRSEMDTTPGRYLQHIRLENARIMLDGGSSVQEAAMRSGFSDASHLIRLFRARYGMTPLQYRREQGPFDSGAAEEPIAMAALSSGTGDWTGWEQGGII